MAINKYDTPAQDKYFNTYVPLPYEQLMNTVVGRQGQLDKEQNMLSQKFDETKNLRYIAGTKDEQYVKDYINNVSQLVDKYYTADLSNPVVKQQLRREFNSATDRTRIQDIQSSHANWMQNSKIKAQLKAEGLYDQAIDEDPANADFSSENGIYQYTTQAYKNPRGVGEQYFNNIKPSDMGIQGNFYVQGVDERKINSVADAKWNEFANTSEGSLYVKKIGKELGLDYTNPEVKKQIATEYLKGIGKEFTYIDKSPLPEYMSAGDDKKGKAVRPTTQTQTVRSTSDFDPYGVGEMKDFDESGNVIVNPEMQVAGPPEYSGMYGTANPLFKSGVDKEQTALKQSELKGKLDFVRKNIPQLQNLSDKDTYQAYRDITKDGKAFPDLPKVDLTNIPREELAKILGNSVTDRYLKVQDEFGESELRYFNDTKEGSPLKDLGYTPEEFRSALINAGNPDKSGVTIEGLAQNGPESGMIILGVPDKSRKGEPGRSSVGKIRKVYISTNDQLREIMRGSNEVYENMRNFVPGTTIIGYNASGTPVAARVNTNIYYDDKAKKWQYEPSIEGGYLVGDQFISTGPEDISSINQMQLENLTGDDFTNAQWASSQINLTPNTKPTF